MFLIAILAACCAAPAQADDAKVVLFKARITSLADAGKEPADLGPNTVNFYRAVKVGIMDVERLLGDMPEVPERVELYMSAWPIVGSKLSHIYVLANVGEQGELTVLRWNYANGEYCISAASAAALNIAAELDALYARGRIRCSSRS